MNVKSFVLALAAAGAVGAGLAGDADPAWSGAAMKAWREGMNQVSKAEPTADGMRFSCGGSDSFVYSPWFRIPARPTQEVVFRARGNVSGAGELFWMKPGKGPTQSLSCSFQWIGDGKWHDYRVRPYWQGEREIGRLRIDFPTGAVSGGVFELAGCRIETGADAISVPAADHAGVSFSTVATNDYEMVILWAGDGQSGVKRERVRVPGDGRVHRHYLSLGQKAAWKGNICLLRAEVPEGQSAPTDLRFEKDEPEIPVDIIVRRARVSDAFVRAGIPASLSVLVQNLGTVTAENAQLVPVSLPAGMRVTNAAALSGDVFGESSKTFAVAILCDRPGAFTAGFELRAAGMRPVPVKVPVSVLPSLNLPKADYVPEPHPVATDYDIAALYFPGWSRIEAWERVWKVCPERKPVLGWYDEGNPEVVDWQIKWLVENGIRTLYVDWYWSKGSQHLDHWVKAFYKAKYRRHLKWAMMWANHNAPGSHSEADQRKVTQFWIDNYFNTPEYLRIDGKPVVWMWSVQNMEQDMSGRGGCRRLLEISREMAVAAGFKGIHFIAMKWPEATCTAAVIQGYKDLGFDMTGIYHFMSHGGACKTNRRFPYSAVADANPANWWRQQEANVLPFIPNLSTGWDDRPWNDHCEIYGKNAGDFRRICVAAKDFADKTGVKRICLSPLNEWGEGSYAEPNAEHGFGFYEAVRETFCRKPAGGWPLNYGPKDVGLGPYDLPMPKEPRRVTSWTFGAGDSAGWSPLMGIDGFTAGAGGLSFTTSSCDPAIQSVFVPVEAKKYAGVEVRMAVTCEKDQTAQLFWAAPGASAAERTSCCRPVTADGVMRTYSFPVGKSSAWRGRVNHFRLDPCNVKGARVVIESIRLK